MSGTDVFRFTQTPLLSAVDKDLTQTGKQSVRECLREKTLPCQAVKKALETQNIEPQDLTFANAAITSRLTELKMRPTEAASIHYISSLATVIRFIHVLFEYKAGLNENMSNQSPPPNEPEVKKMFVHIVHALVGLITYFLEQRRPTANDNSVSDVNCPLNTDITGVFDADQVAYFVFGSLLRVDRYVKHRPAFLLPLWKPLDDIARATTLPVSLVNESINLLLDYLKSGTEVALTTCADVLAYQPSNPQQSAMHTKILGFLVGRLSTYLNLKVARAEDSDLTPTLHKVFSLLCLLRGMALMTEAGFTDETRGKSTAFLKLYRQLASKVERCVMDAICLAEDETEESFVASTLLLTLLDAPALTLQVADDDHECNLALQTFALGKSALLTQVLVKSSATDTGEEPKPWSEQDAESVIRTCQALIFDTLPCCHATLVWKTCTVTQEFLGLAVQSIARAMLICETTTPSIASNAEPGRGRFHRLLVNWLVPNQGRQHPLSTELALTVVQLHILSLDRLGLGHDAATPLLALCTKLLIQEKTSPSLRSALASLLVRLHGSTELSDSVDKLLAPEIVRLERTVRPAAGSKKRKRSEKRPEYTADDLLCLTKVFSLSKTPVELPEALLDAMPHDRPSRRHLLYALFQSSLQLKPSLRIKVMTRCQRLWNAQRNRQPPIASSTELARLTVSLLRRAASKDTITSEEVSSLLQFFICLVNAGLLVPGANLGVVHAMIDALGQVGRQMQPCCQQPVLQELVGSFRCLIACEFWPIRAHAMSALVVFASTIPATLKNVLPQCLPPQRQTLFTCRLQGCLDKNSKPSDPDVVQIRFAAFLLNASFARPTLMKVFPVSTTYTLALGSYFMSMPTQDGRKALVIFPPGSQSLIDIDYMMGTEDENDRPTVQTLRSVSVFPNGTCKLHLED